MSVTVASCTLADIFSADITNTGINAADNSQISGKLTIPEYQRPYRWSEVQLTKLLDDYQHYKKDLATTQERYNYYLGSVILHQSNEGGFLNIIDGQQRLTSLALIIYIKTKLEGRKLLDISMRYESPESQQQIMQNLTWLESHKKEQIADFDPQNINLTLVVTRSEDDAYRFFETQNTGGVRLGGPDIIKAYHLRAVDRDSQNEFARKWERLGNLNAIVNSLIKARYWQTLSSRTVPSHREPNKVRTTVVDELGGATGKGADIAFGRFERVYFADGGQQDKQAQQGYAMRQPLNSGANAIHFLRYFESLRVKYLADNDQVLTVRPALSGFNDFYHNLVCTLDGCSYLKGLYDTSLLFYISQFGEQQLETAAKKLFRVIYSPRVSNQKSVREASIPAFVRDNPVLDWIDMSYTPEMCFEYLDRFIFKVDPANLDPGKNSVKKRFVFKVLGYFDIDVSENLEAQALAGIYQAELDRYMFSLSNRNNSNKKNTPVKEASHV